ncbi:hypothetical protein SAMN05421820_102376 [Pedobacter steynii]|uniref:Uncharacterized protein n=1 Tax=Pedobacter steynii TaxID=430522 RepID=A0A1G9NLX3_9SPHI|nr:hypothetical protein SAMN05421820_102376 [Pedobacter steynii]
MNKSRINKIAIAIFVASLVLIIISHLIIELLLRDYFSNQTGTLLYSICYVVIYGSIFLSLLSFLTLLAQFLRRPKKT